MNAKKILFCICSLCIPFIFSGCNYENCKQLFTEVRNINLEYKNNPDPEQRKYSQIGYCMEWDFTPAARAEIEKDGCVKKKKPYQITGKVIKARKTPFVGKLFKDKIIDDVGTTKQVFTVATNSNGEFAIATRVSSSTDTGSENAFPFYPLLSVKNSKNPYVNKKMGYLIPTGFSAENNFKRCE